MLSVNRDSNKKLRLVNGYKTLIVSAYGNGNFKVQAESSQAIVRKSGTKNIAFIKPAVAASPAS